MTPVETLMENPELPEQRTLLRSNAGTSSRTVKGQTLPIQWPPTHGRTTLESCRSWNPGSRAWGYLSSQTCSKRQLL